MIYWIIFGKNISTIIIWIIANFDTISLFHASALSFLLELVKHTEITSIRKDQDTGK